jgi:hypothetical protein
VMNHAVNGHGLADGRKSALSLLASICIL